MKVGKYLFCAILFLFFFKTTAQTLRGTVIDAETGGPVTGATVQLRRAQSGAEIRSIASNPDGAFSFEDIHPGYYRCEISSVGYAPQTVAEISIAAGKLQILEIALIRQSTALPNVVVSTMAPGRRTMQPLSEIPLSRDQTLRFPSMYFDPARLAAAYPGVAQTDDGINGMSIRGNNPGSVRWKLEGVDVVNPNHLPNAGTFSDRPATASGGTLMFSAQLLDNSALLTGAFPADYGDALGGIMDMNLRRGNSERHEFTAQAGLIGLDLAAEGPLAKKGKSSYLVNYRYSTVGLLGKMGVSFGGEQIGFQDLSFKCAFTGKKGGEWTFFGLGGLSENLFKPKTDSSAVEQYKDFFNIDFKSQTGLMGLSYRTSLGAKTWIKVASILSGQHNERHAAGLGLLDDDENTETRAGLVLTLGHKINGNNRLLGGLNSQYIVYDGLAQQNRKTTFDGHLALQQYQPFVSWEWSGSSRFSTKLGLHGNFYRTIDDQPQSDFNLEPRALLQYRLTPHHALALAYGLNSQLNPLWLQADTRSGFTDYNLTYPNRGAGFVRAHHVGLRHNWLINDAWTLKSELFWQSQFNIPLRSDDAAFSLYNQTELLALDYLNLNGKTENKGIEIGLEHYLSDDWFLAANTTLFDSRYKGYDQQWRASRWDLGHLANLTAGKEWYKERTAEKAKAFGLNGRVVWTGGYREMPVDSLASAQAQATRFDTRNGFSVKQPDYYRIDLRVYWKRSRGNRRNSTFAMDFQNITSRKNIAYRYYDPFTKQVETKYQLALIPNMSWRLEF
jgi:hypothetical protein